MPPETEDDISDVRDEDLLDSNTSETRKRDWTDIESLRKEVHDALMINIRTYATADKYDISELKELAHHRMISRFRWRPWPIQDFHIVVLEAIRIIPHNDKGIRETILRICANFIEDLVGNVPKRGINTGT